MNTLIQTGTILVTCVRERERERERKSPKTSRTWQLVNPHPLMVVIRPNWNQMKETSLPFSDSICNPARVLLYI